MEESVDGVELLPFLQKTMNDGFEQTRPTELRNRKRQTNFASVVESSSTWSKLTYLGPNQRISGIMKWAN